MYGFGGVGLSEVQISISELSVVGGGGGWWTRQTHFMVGPGRGPTKKEVGDGRLHNQNGAIIRRISNYQLGKRSLRYGEGWETKLCIRPGWAP